jgi:catechol 2,3-dioxygenase-like lactoylglutathione lyase family enzyme
VNLNHLDLQVADVQRSVDLFERLLGLRLQSSRTSPAIAILSDGAGFTLVLQRRKDDAPYPDGFHFGFLVDDPATVRAFQAAARAWDSLEVSEVLENGRGVLTYARTWDGLLFEVSWQRPRAHS